MEQPCPLANPLMEFQVNLIEIGRAKMRDLATALSRDQLFTIPKGFHNNILWNIGHTVVAQQVLCYKNSDLPLRVPAYALPLFGKGTRPSEWVGHIDPAEVMLWVDQTTEFLREDLHHQVFKSYTPYTTSNGNTLHSISEALSFVTWHEALHIGIMLSQRKLV